jgi:hypothetical protein
MAGIGQDYLASVSATVTSTGGDATLTVTDPNVNAGHLVNGSFTLANALQANATDGAHPTGVFAPISGNPLVLLTYSAPISLDAVTVNLKQTIGANEPLRTGAYSKTLTFTLSTTTP